MNLKVVNASAAPKLFILWNTPAWALEGLLPCIQYFRIFILLPWTHIVPFCYHATVHFNEFRGGKAWCETPLYIRIIVFWLKHLGWQPRYASIQWFGIVCRTLSQWCDHTNYLWQLCTCCNGCSFINTCDRYLRENHFWKLTQKHIFH